MSLAQGQYHIVQSNTSGGYSVEVNDEDGVVVVIMAHDDMIRNLGEMTVLYGESGGVLAEAEELMCHQDS